MKLVVQQSQLSGAVDVPGSKSHTIRALLIDTLAQGTSRVLRPLRSNDTESCARACEALGARITRESPDVWKVGGTAGRPRAAPDTIDVGNSGTTLFLALSAAALAEGVTVFTGDEQIRKRSAAPLLAALRTLGAGAEAEGADGCAPLRVRGPLTGGQVTIECPTSQYLSSLLLACPLAREDTVIHVPLLNERPYAEMTLGWLARRGIRFSRREDFTRFTVRGGQKYPSDSDEIPADYSSATFFLVAGAVTGSTIRLRGLDPDDTQGDRRVLDMVEEMGCEVSWAADGLRVAGPQRLTGATFDLNATPDALPALAVAGCLAEGTTRLTNVPQARLKETDRITVMATELRRMGAEVEELSDGLVLHGGALQGAELHGYADHRVVMALAVAGLAAEGTTTVDTAESVSVTFPDFVGLMRALGAEMKSEG